jgi:hypothetical protein
MNSPCNITLEEGLVIEHPVTIQYLGPGSIEVETTGNISSSAVLAFDMPQTSLIFSRFKSNSMTYISIQVSTLSITDSVIDACAGWQISGSSLSHISVQRSSIISSQDIFAPQDSNLTFPLDITVEDSILVASNSVLAAFDKDDSRAVIFRRSRVSVSTLLASPPSQLIVEDCEILLGVQMVSVFANKTVELVSLRRSKIGALNGGTAAVLARPTVPFSVEKVEMIDLKMSSVRLGVGTQTIEEIWIERSEISWISLQTWISAVSPSSRSGNLTIINSKIDGLKSPTTAALLTYYPSTGQDITMNVWDSTIHTFYALGVGASTTLNQHTTVIGIMASQSSTDVISGPGTLEITAFIVGSAQNLRVDTAFIYLHSLTASTTQIEIGDKCTFVYVPSNPTLGMTTAGLNASQFSIDWRYPTLPTAGTVYPLATNTQSGMVYYDYQGEFNITVLRESTSTYFSFNPVPCHANCIPERTTTCTSRHRCTCLVPWSGKYCDCDTTNMLPSMIYCSVTGGPSWESSGSITTDDDYHLSIPQGHSFLVAGNLTLASNATLKDGNSISISGNLNAHSGIQIRAKLLELRSSSGCIVQSDIQISASTLIFGPTSMVEIELDLTSLSTDGSCISPTDSNMDLLVNSTLNSWGSVTMAEKSVWKISLLPGPLASSYSFQYDILSSTDTLGSSGISSHVSLDAAGTACAQISQETGKLWLSVGCPFIPSAPLTSPPQSSATLLQWSATMILLAILKMCLE